MTGRDEVTGCRNFAVWCLSFVMPAVLSGYI
jgi:hypothetical protein